MDTIDVLGNDEKRRLAYSRELLDETNDEELQLIVKKAAEDLSSPMAIVSIVLDHIQFFKASFGLPKSLSEAKGTHRDASFCQFVVRDKAPFEVNDAANDSRVPQQVVKDYDIQSYLGVPIKVDKTVIGSLCVLDTKSRKFTEEDRKSLARLSEMVNERLANISKNRKKSRLKLTEKAIKPGIKELSEKLEPIQASINGVYASIAAVRTFLVMTNSIFTEDSNFSDTYKSSYKAALKANEDSEAHLSEVEYITEDIKDEIAALELLTNKNSSLKLSEIIASAQDLAVNATKGVGGFKLPDVGEDPVIYPNGMMAIAIISNCLISFANELKENNSNSGINSKIEHKEGHVKLIFNSKDLKPESLSKINKKLSDTLNKDPSVSCKLNNENLELDFIAL